MAQSCVFQPEPSNLCPNWLRPHSKKRPRVFLPLPLSRTWKPSSTLTAFMMLYPWFQCFKSPNGWPSVLWIVITSPFVRIWLCPLPSSKPSPFRSVSVISLIASFTVCELWLPAKSTASTLTEYVSLASKLGLGNSRSSPVSASMEKCLESSLFSVGKW